MKKDNKTNMSDDYMDKLEEWQDNQYNPGYYTQGRIPPIYTHPGRPKLLGYLFIFMAVVLSIILIIILTNISQAEDKMQLSFICILLSGLIILQLVGGLRMIKRKAGKEQQQDN